MKPWLLGIALCLTLIGGCGTTIGNGLIKLDSTPYTNVRSFFGHSIARFGWSVSEFKFCVTKLKLVARGGSPVAYQGNPDIEVILGLIDVSNENATTTWGQVEAPVEFDLEEMRVEVHKDAERCSGADYSVIYNGTKLDKDLEFRFAFNPPIRLNAGDTLKLGLTNIAIAFQQAANAGQLTNELIGNYLTAETKGTGTE